MTTYLMNPRSGTVQTAEEWAEEGFTSENADLVEVVQVTTATVNDKGIDEIADVLAARHLLGGDHFTIPMFRAWAAEAEYNYINNGGAFIEITSKDTVSGHTELYEVSDAGLDFETKWAEV